MMERIKNALAEGPRAAASTIHYLYLARIPFLGWLTLFVLPLFARWVGRPLVLGAYDLASGGDGPRNAHRVRRRVGRQRNLFPPGKESHLPRFSLAWDQDRAPKAERIFAPGFRRCRDR